MTDVFDAMKAHVDAITEHLTAMEIAEKAANDLVRARKRQEECQAYALEIKRKRDNTEHMLCAAIDTARKATRNTGVAVS